MKLILTLDYELFGDGTGDVFKHIIAPTETILSIFNKHNIKTTIFFEVVEYWYLKKEWESGNTMGYDKNPIAAIDSQLIKAFSEGHDIQLHLHPQWLGARYNENRWQLNLDNWRLSDFDLVEGYNQNVLIEKGIKTLENLLKPIDANYSPSIIRAGGFNVVPSLKISDAMINNRILIDSSVYPGGYEDGDLSIYDYRKVSYKQDYWIADPNDFSVPSTTEYEILEIPIFALPIKRYKKFSYPRLKSILLNKKSAFESAQSKLTNKSLVERVLYWFEEEALTWDYCLFSGKMHDYFFNYIQQYLKNERNAFVLIGHSKNFTSKSDLERFINKANETYSFVHLSDYSKSVTNMFTSK